MQAFSVFKLGEIQEIFSEFFGVALDTIWSSNAIMADLPSAQNHVRADLWLWSVRLFKSRALAAEACRGGQVLRLGHALKAASPVRVGDILEVTTAGGPRTVRVEKPIDRRVGASLAVACYTDLTSQAVMEAARQARLAAQAERQPGTGRPTKLERREIDQLRRALRNLGYPGGESVE